MIATKKTAQACIIASDSASTLWKSLCPRSEGGIVLRYVAVYILILIVFRICNICVFIPFCALRAIFVSGVFVTFRTLKAVD